MWLRSLLAILFLLACPARIPASPVAGGLCQQAIAKAEAGSHVPDEFLLAIARVESGRPDPSNGLVAAWPWTVNAEGQGSYYASKEQAVEAVRALQKAGVRSIDVGCLQVNLMHHPEAFASLEEAFDPDVNAHFAASFLVSLFEQTGSWPHAAAAYHSQTPTLGADYQKKVLAAWALPSQAPAAGASRLGADRGPPVSSADTSAAGSAQFWAATRSPASSRRCKHRQGRHSPSREETSQPIAACRSHWPGAQPPNSGGGPAERRRTTPAIWVAPASPGSRASDGGTEPGPVSFATAGAGVPHAPSSERRHRNILEHTPWADDP